MYYVILKYKFVFRIRPAAIFSFADKVITVLKVSLLQVFEARM